MNVLKTAVHPKAAWSTHKRNASQADHAPFVVFILFSVFPLNFCVLLAHDIGHLWVQVLYKDSRTDVQGE